MARKLREEGYGSVAAISYHGPVHDVQAIEWEPRGPAARREQLAALEQGVARPVYAVAEDASGGHSSSSNCTHSGGTAASVVTPWRAQALVTSRGAR